jgi:tRNA U34 5-methylaminomethyl-2-thiouridine-forming methyltransferase MnmC
MLQILVFMSNNKNELKVIETEDGSYSIYNELLDETYHSKYGALQESQHVFINHGLHLLNSKSFNILEIGFGTGLNASLTYVETLDSDITINYTALEPYPLSKDIIYEVAKGYSKTIAETMILLSQSEGGKSVNVGSDFRFTFHLTQLQTFNFIDKFDLIYFDAFAPDKQPDMWTTEIFLKLFEVLKPEGLLTTYCAKGQVKRNLKQAGFTVKTFPGPPGKREMTVAFR